MKSQLVPLILGLLFFGIAALSQESLPLSSPHQDDRYRGRDDTRSGNRIAPEHENPPTPTPPYFNGRG